MADREVITIVVDPEWKEIVLKKAKLQNQTLAAYVRAAIQEKMLNEHSRMEAING